MKAAKPAGLVVAIWMTVGAVPVRADGVCENDFRDTTAEERAMMISILESVRAVLPAAPEGWIIGGYEELSAQERICRDFEATPWQYSHGRIFNRVDDAAEREQFMADAGAVLRDQAEARQPQMDALMARMQTLGAELGEAAQRGDEQRIAELNAQIEAMQKEFDALLNEAPGEAQATAIGAIYMRDRSMEIGVAINPVAVSITNLSVFTPPDGVRAAYRGEYDHDGVTYAQALFLLGDWQERDDGAQHSLPHGDVPPVAAQSMAVTVTADPSRIDSLLATIDFPSLADLIR